MGMLLMACAGISADAMAQVRSTPDYLIRGELKFPRNAGWGKPIMTRSGDGFVAQLWFAEAPMDAVSSLASQMNPTKRRTLTQVEVYRIPGQTVVQIHFRSKAKGLFVKRAHNPGGWKLVAHLHQPPEIPGVSYADRKLIPSFLVRVVLGAVDHALRNGEIADCDALDIASNATHGWPGWVLLGQADCYRQRGQKELAANVVNRLVRQRSMPRAAVVLAALRLEEWPETYNPWIRLAISNKGMKSLPRSVTQELNIRQARKMVREGRTKRAINSLLIALAQSILPLELEWACHDLRLELMESALEKDRADWAIRLFQAMTPPSTDHPAYLPTLRNAAVAYTRLGYMDQAVALSAIVLEPKGSVVDPELTTSIVQSLRGAGDGRDTRALASAIPTELHWIGMLSEKSILTASTSLLLAEWLLDIWEEAGVSVARNIAKSALVQDPGQAFGEARMAVMLGAKDCASLMDDTPGSLPLDKAAFASLCYLQDGSSVDPLEPWSPDRMNPLEDGGMLGYAVKEYVRGSSEFYDELGEVSQTLEKLKKDRPELFGVGNEIDLQLRNDENYKSDGTDADPLRSELSQAGKKIHAEFHYEMASDSIKKAAARLQEEGNLDKDSALREAVKMHAEASAKLLDSISKKEGTP